MTFNIDPKVSFIMPAKNAGTYISKAIDSVIAQIQNSWELIIVNDHSEDNTYEIAQKAAYKDKRIRVYTSHGNGQAAALNTGYSNSSGRFIKCFDADDILHKNFLSYCNYNTKYVVYHNAYATDSRMNIVGITKTNSQFIRKDFKYCLRNLISTPRCFGTFPRAIADKIFPIVEDYDCADYWISLMIKRHARKIVHIDKPLYYYRQHSQQTYGGLFNFNNEKVLFRAKRKLNFAKSVEDNNSLIGYSKYEVRNSLKQIKTYFSILGKNKPELKDIMFSQISLKYKSKLFFIKRLSLLSSLIKRLRVQSS